MTTEIRLSAAVWDMDGTLEDSEPLHYEAYRRCAARYGVDFTEQQYRRFTGQTDRLICETMVAQFKLPVTPERFLEEKEAIYPEIVNGNAVPMPGVLNLLDALRSWQVPQAVASSSTRPTIEMILGALNIRDYFSVIASGDEVVNSKPHPDIYYLAAKRLSTYPFHCLGFEDSENGVRALDAANMYSIARPCPWTVDQNHSLATVKVASFEEVIIGDRTLQVGDTIFRFRK